MQNSIYKIPSTKGDIARIYWLALFLWVCGAVVSLIVATQYVAGRFNYHPDLGGLMVGDHQRGGLYFPAMIFVWMFKYWRPDVSAVVRTVISQGAIIAAVGGTFSFMGALWFVLNRTRKLRKAENHLHGSASWANAEEIKATGLLASEENRGGVMLGGVAIDDRTLREKIGVLRSFLRGLGKIRWWSPSAIREHFAAHFKEHIRYLRHKGPEHILVFAPTRSGKGVGIVVPTLLSWDESALVHDIKGENWALTSGFREKVLKQRCLRFSPAEIGSARFNPLGEIRLDDNIVKDVQNIATIIVDPDGKGLQDHWAKTGFDLLTGVILYVLLDGEITKQQKSLATVQAILSDGGVIREQAERLAKERAEKSDSEPVTGVRAVMEFIRDRGYENIQRATQAWQRIGWQTAAQAAQAFLNKAPNEASGVLSTALSFLSLYRDPIVAENTSESDFTIESLMQRKTSLYLVVPPSDKDRLKPLLRLIINQVVRRLTESMEFEKTGASRQRYAHRLLLLIDEFPALGKLDVFEEALAFIAGYGLKAMLIAQDLSQLQKAYTKDESIISNCHIRIAFAPNKIETAELLSKMTGQATVSYEQRNFSGNRLSIILNNVSTNEQIVQRPLLTADETMRLPATDELVFVAGHKPIYARKIRYYADPALSRRQQLGEASRWR